MSETKVPKKTEKLEGAPKDLSSLSSLRLPYNEDEERGVLGAMLLDNDIINEVMDRLQPEDFYNPGHQLVYRAILEIYESGKPVELVLLVDHLRRQGKLEASGGYVAIASLEQFIVSTGHAPELAHQIKDKSTLRRLMAAAEKILRDSSSETRDASDQVSAAEKLIFDISQQTEGGEFVSVADIMPQTIEDIGNLRGQTGEVSGVPTGFIDLDKVLNGLHKADLLILAARPSIGKTTFALNLIMNVALYEKTPAAIFSLEMSAQSLNQRLLCSYARQNNQDVSRGFIKESEFRDIREKAAELAACPIYIDDTPSLSIMQLRSRARRLKAIHPDLGFIVVDYLQLMTGSDKSANRSRQEEVSEISRGLKALARELQLPVMALSQLSRNIEQRSGKDKSAKPMLSDLRESGAIEQDADVVMFVHRERVETQRDESGNLSKENLAIETEIIVGKHRNGPIGTAKLLFFPNWTRFENKAYDN